jgi:small subunit ribosomal protein S4e
MTNHQKRLSVPDSWPVERKTATFTVKAEGPHGDSGVPLVIVLRDVLEYVNSTKEADYAVNSGGVLVNGGSPTDSRRPIGMFDILSFPDRDEYYRVFPDQGGRLGLTPIDEDAANSRLGKIIDKTTVSGDRTQLNLHDGSNLLVEESVAPEEQRGGGGVPADPDEYSGGDSVVVENESKEIVAHFPFEEGALVTAVNGAHAGEIGEISEIDVTPGSSSNIVRVASQTQREGGEAAENDGDDEFETVAEYVVVIDEKFTGEDAADETTEGGDDE